MLYSCNGVKLPKSVLICVPLLLAKEMGTACQSPPSAYIFCFTVLLMSYPYERQRMTASPSLWGCAFSLSHVKKEALKTKTIDHS